MKTMPTVVLLAAMAAISPAQTPQLVKDVRAGTLSSSPRFLTDHFGRLLFSAIDPRSRLFVSDGTAAGTTAILDRAIQQMFPARGRTFCWENTSFAPRMYVTDGTKAGTTQVQYPRGFVLGPYAAVLGDEIYMYGTDNAHGAELWKSDGSQVTLVKDISPGPHGSGPRGFVVIDGTLYFTANTPTHGGEFYKSDGTAQGTVMVADINSGRLSSLPDGFTGFKGKVFFTAYDPPSWGLYESDGTKAGTKLVKTFNVRPHSLTVLGDYLLMSVRGYLFRSDGTANGTAMLKQIRARGPGVQEFTVVGKTMFFTAFEDVIGRELWKTDATAAGTVRVKDITPGLNGVGPLQITAVGTRHVIFIGNDGRNGQEPWISDGSSTGTRMVELQPGSTSSLPQLFTVVAGTVYFSAHDRTHGRELWKWFPGATAKRIGSGCAVSGLPPTAVATDPVLGGTARFTISGVPSGRTGVLAIGLAAMPPLSIRAGCYSYVDPRAFVPITFVSGGSPLGLAIGVPNDPTLDGAFVAGQVWVLGPTGAFDLGNGLHLVAGG